MTKTYDPTQVSIQVGVASLKSWNGATPSMEEEGWFFSAGTTGEDTRSKNANKLGTLTITMPQSSDDNDKLTGIYNAGSTIKVTMKDNNGRSLFLMPTGTIAKLPDVECAKESGEVEWLIKGKWGVYFVGGMS